MAALTGAGLSTLCEVSPDARRTPPSLRRSGAYAAVAALLLLAAAAPVANAGALPCPTITLNNATIASSCTSAQICTTCVQTLAAQIVPQLRTAVAATPALLNMSEVTPPNGD